MYAQCVLMYVCIYVCMYVCMCCFELFIYGVYVHVVLYFFFQLFIRNSNGLSEVIGKIYTFRMKVVKVILYTHVCMYVCTYVSVTNSINLTCIQKIFRVYYCCV